MNRDGKKQNNGVEISHTTYGILVILPTLYMACYDEAYNAYN